MPWTACSTILLLAIFLGAWEAYVRFFGVSSLILPPPSAVVGGLIVMVGETETWNHVWVTVYETVLGFFFATVIGISLGAVLGKILWLEKTLNPFIIATQVVPKVALVPLFVVWFGFGPSSKVIVSAVLAFFPIFTNTLLGVKSVDTGHREVMRSLNASRWHTFWRLELPSALPYVLTGMEIGVVLAIIGAVVGEYLGGNAGLGHMAVAAMNAYQTNQLFAVIILLTGLGFSFYVTITALRRLIVPWHESVFVNRDQG
ncbi:MAG: ABC transporter permease [Rhodospirillaceae bacterium]|nr:ABC transporter permease [Rhodospirillaceae bacterium]